MNDSGGGCLIIRCRVRLRQIDNLTQHIIYRRDNGPHCASGSLTGFMQESLPKTGGLHGVFLERHIGLASPRKPGAKGIGVQKHA
jgi:hypothetical protein